VRRAHDDVAWIEIGESDRQWRFDRAFLSSSWRCIYGAGCQGIHPTHNPARADGCCTLGAGITDSEDFLVVEQAAKLLDPSNWQYASYAGRVRWWKRKPNGDIFTRVTKGGCIFLNRPGFAAGPGCALHAKAVADGINPLHRKPNVCWQLPLRIDEDHTLDGTRRSTVRRWERSDFGDDGEGLSWWCTDPFADATNPAPLEHAVVTTMAPELRALCGDDVYGRLVAALGLAATGAAGGSPIVSIK
jgi:hypothetical protein